MIRSCLLRKRNDDNYLKSEVFVQLGNFKYCSTTLEYWKHTECASASMGIRNADKENVEVMMSVHLGELN